MSTLSGIVFLASGLFLVSCVFAVIFSRRLRSKALFWGAVCLVPLIGSLVTLSASIDAEAQAQGFAGYSDRLRAEEAGYTDPIAWAKVREANKARQSAEQEEAEQALFEVVTYVTNVTRDLPNRFLDHGNLIPEEARMQPFPGDVMAYARFYWAMDSIEGSCQYLGQRTNIQLLAPDNGVTSWVDTASASPDHPNYREYLGIFEKFDTAARELGQAALCPAIYALLGPDGSLMEDALGINNLIDPEIVHRWEVRAEDGIIWSSRDYCDRRYFLEQGQQSLHDLSCNEAKVQDF